MKTEPILLIVIGVILLIALLLLFGGGMAISGTALLGGLMATSIVWGALLVIFILGGILSYAAIY